MLSLRIAGTYLTLAVSAALYVAFHRQGALTLPVPWPDEFHFMLTARAWLDERTFLAPELHPERPLMWMPPGYAIILANVFRWTGVALTAARGLSMVCALLAALCFWAFSRRSVPRIVSAVVAGLLLMHPAWIVTGNVARMDALTLLLACGGFALLRAARLYPGLALILGSALVHPNGVVFAFSGALAACAYGKLVRSRPTPADAVIAVLVLAGYAGYAVHVLANLGGFVEDMHFQFARKADAFVWSTFSTPRSAAALLLAGFAWVPRYREAIGWLAALGLPAWFVTRVGREMWYDPYDVLFLACFVSASIVLITDVGQRARQRYGSVGLLLPVAGSVALLASLLDERPRRPSEIRWRNMAVASEPYVDADTVDAVAARLSATIPGIAVEFFPRGDAALFLRTPGVEIVDPVRHAHGASWRVLHESPHHPPHWRKQILEWLDHEEDGRPVLLHGRNEIDRWWLVPIPPFQPDLRLKSTGG